MGVVTDQPHRLSPAPLPGAARGDELDRAVAHVRDGGLLLLPTDTVYGIGTTAADGAAIAQLLAAKGEPPAKNSLRLSDLVRRPRLTYEDLAPLDPDRPALSQAVREQVEISLKYEGYIARQQRQVEEMRRLEGKTLPADLDYHQLAGLRLEARQKLDAIRPGNLGQAARISGVSPADVAALMIALERQNRPGETP